MGNDTRIAVDVAKAVFEVAISDRPGHVAHRPRLQRAEFLPFMAQQPAATVLMEACGSAHHWGRKLEALGHRVILLPPHQVRPYVHGNKTDRTDAKGILEASRNEDIHAVPIKSVAQQVLTSLHRLRSGWVKERTAKINTLRGLLRELGFFIPVGVRHVVPAAWLLIEDADSDLPDPSVASWPRRAMRSGRSTRESRGWSDSSKPRPSSCPRLLGSLPFQGSASSRQRRSSPSWATSDASPRDDTWRATSGSRLGSSPAASSVDLVAFPSEATATYAPS